MKRNLRKWHLRNQRIDISLKCPFHLCLLLGWLGDGQYWPKSVTRWFQYIRHGCDSLCMATATLLPITASVIFSRVSLSIKISDRMEYSDILQGSRVRGHDSIWRLLIQSPTRGFHKHTKLAIDLMIILASEALLCKKMWPSEHWIWDLNHSDLILFPLS